MTEPKSGTSPGFTSDLTVDELVLLRNAGWEPIAFVSGDCTSDPGDGYWSPTGSQGDALTRGLSTAMQRIRRQAADVGAAGVVGVRLTTTEIEVSEEAPSLFHFSAIGTAVRPTQSTSASKTPPFTSHLSGQDTWALLDASCRPLGMVFGVGFYRPKRRLRRQSGLHEMTDLNNAVYGARERAMHHMQSQASQLHASGVVGVTVKMTVAHERNVTFTAIGTAIAAPARRPGDPGPRLAIELTDTAPTAIAEGR